MIRKILFVTANLCVLALAGVHLYDAWNVNRFAGVGGHVVYYQARLKQLEDARNRLDHLTPEVREAEEAAIEEQIRELQTGSKAVEFGDELRRVK
jgi:hypothetical protein